MRIRPASMFAAIVAMVVSCGEGTPGEPVPPPPLTPLPGSITILTGAGQTDTAGAIFPVSVTIEVRDTGGAPLPGVPIWFGEAPVIGAFNDALRDTTTATGRAEFIWRPEGFAGLHRLRASVYLEDAARVLHLVVADTITSTVLSASPDQVQLNGPASLLLGEPFDMSTVIGLAHDRYSNPVTITSIAVEAPAPFEVNGTVVHSDVEVDSIVSIVINGLPFAYRLLARRDLRALTGAEGGWVCDKDPGAVTATPGLFVRRRDGQVTVDSVVLRSDGQVWTFFFSATYDDQLSDGTTAADAYEYTRVVVAQSPGRWIWEYGPEVVQTSVDPLAYENTAPDDCLSWDTIVGGPPAHVPLHFSK